MLSQQSDYKGARVIKNEYANENVEGQDKDFRKRPVRLRMGEQARPGQTGQHILDKEKNILYVLF